MPTRQMINLRAKVVRSDVRNTPFDALLPCNFGPKPHLHSPPDGVVDRVADLPATPTTWLRPVTYVIDIDIDIDID